MGTRAFHILFYCVLGPWKLTVGAGAGPCVRAYMFGSVHMCMCSFLIAHYHFNYLCRLISVQFWLTDKRSYCIRYGISVRSIARNRGLTCCDCSLFWSKLFFARILYKLCAVCVGCEVFVTLLLLHRFVDLMDSIQRNF